ncbi:MAG TPA: 4-hydroxy-3-methylbut-2-enyl diphosphate reductase, partial [Thermotoga sp.]|nr:4-hydroxy-3-methylbut-2-enyl diphosphate reductase [Thermotoga sp.]
MRIVVAEDVGFCFGVKRAVEHVKELLSKGEKVYTDGDIVHNPLVMKELEELGLKKINDIPEDSKNSIFVVRAHGLPPARINHYKKHFKEVVDLTCPIVEALFKKAKNASKKGKVVVFGKRDHPEMKALSGYAPHALITLSPIPLKEEIVYIMAQTTAPLESFKEFVAEEIKMSDFAKA